MMENDKLIDTPIEELAEFTSKGIPVFVTPRGVAWIIPRASGGSLIEYHGKRGVILVDCPPDEVRAKMAEMEKRFEKGGE